jgi:cytochrome b involved in lipid metabolism
MNFIDSIIVSIISSLLVLLPTSDTSVRQQADASVTVSATSFDEQSFIQDIRGVLEELRIDYETRSDGMAASDVSTEEDRSDEDDAFSRGDEGRGVTPEASKSDQWREPSRNNSEDDEIEFEDEDEYEDDSDEDEERNNPSVVRAGAPVAAVLPRATAQNTVTTKTFTLADIKTHNSVASCYTVVHGTVYDVSSWIAKHPGGQAAIKGMCGMDATASFDGQHGGSARPESELAQFKIGVLAR